MSEKGVAANTKIPVEEAAVFLQAFFQRYGGISTFRQELWAKARREGCQWSNIFGRTRRLPDLSSEIFWKRKRAERQMIGSAIQGTAAELTKAALVRIADLLVELKLPAMLVNTVHDEIQLDTPKECLGRVVQVCKQAMEDFPEFHPIPIIAEPAVTYTNWAEKTHYAPGDAAHG
jgi:DNA polymerase-1